MIEMYQMTGFSLNPVEVKGSWYDIGLAEGREERAAVNYTLYRYSNIMQAIRVKGDLGNMHHIL
jgi:hypothetical protein